MLGYEDHEIADYRDPWLALTHPDDAERIREAGRRHVEGETPHLEAEFRLRHKEGEWR